MQRPCRAGEEAKHLFTNDNIHCSERATMRAREQHKAAEYSCGELINTEDNKLFLAQEERDMPSDGWQKGMSEIKQ